MDKDLFGKYQPQKKKSKATERGDLLKYFAEKLNEGRESKHLKPITIPRVAKMVQQLNLQDLYFIMSDCNQAERKGIPWGAAFYSSLKPRE